MPEKEQLGTECASAIMAASATWRVEGKDGNTEAGAA